MPSSDPFAPFAPFAPSDPSDPVEIKTSLRLTDLGDGRFQTNRHRPNQPQLKRVLVVVPARNEASTITRCLTSLLRARHIAGVEVDVVVVADSCADETPDLARDMLGHCGTVVTGVFGSVGAARRAGTIQGLERSEVSLQQTWIANTDADTFVPTNWFETQLAFAAGGWAAVAGIVALDRVDWSDHQVAQQYFATYTTYNDGSHPHVHGANMAVRGDAYLNAGGWRPLVRSEDRDLWTRLQYAGHPTISTTQLVVTTSARRHGRVPGGFAECLQQFEAAEAV